MKTLYLDCGMGAAGDMLPPLCWNWYLRRKIFFAVLPLWAFLVWKPRRSLR